MVNPLGENSFVLSDETGQCIFIDPGFYYEEEHEEVKRYISDHQLKPVKIINTHCHFDHIMGVEFARKTYNIPFYAHPEDAFWIERAESQGEMFSIKMSAVQAADQFLNEGDVVKFGNTSMEVIHVPGHSPGHVVFYCKKQDFLMAGDVLFYGSIGRTDLPGGDYNTLISKIKQKLFKLPDNTKVYSGHGPETTLGFEKKSNPFLT